MEIMEEFGIYNSIESYEKWGGDIGDIYVLLNGEAFPGKGWTDFGKTILSWWMEEFRKLHSGEAAKVACSFMDGNYRFDVSVIDSKSWRIEFIKEKSEDDEIIRTGTISPDQATESLLKAVEEVVQLYEKEGNMQAVNNFANYKKKFLSDWKK